MISNVLEIAFGVALGIIIAEIVTAIPVAWLLRCLWRFMSNDRWNGDENR